MVIARLRFGILGPTHVDTALMILHLLLGLEPLLAFDGVALKFKALMHLEIVLMQLRGPRQ